MDLKRGFCLGPRNTLQCGCSARILKLIKPGFCKDIYFVISTTPSLSLYFFLFLSPWYFSIGQPPSHPLASWEHTLVCCVLSLRDFSSSVFSGYMITYREGGDGNPHSCSFPSGSLLCIHTTPEPITYAAPNDDNNLVIMIGAVTIITIIIMTNYSPLGRCA